MFAAREFFGPGISSLDPTRAPVESDIVKLCVYVLDNFRTESGNYFLAPDETQMVKIVKGILIEFFKSQDEHAILMQDTSIKNLI